MKPLFEKEKNFFEKRTGVQLPNYCWKDGSKIYLNCKDKKPLLTYKVENKKIIINKNIIKNINQNTVEVEYTKGKKKIQEQWNIKTWKEEYLENEYDILNKEEESIDETVKYILKNEDYAIRISESGGKDSTLTRIMSKKAFERIKNEAKDISVMIEKYQPDIQLYPYSIHNIISNINGYLIDFFNTTNDTAQTYRQVKSCNDCNKLLIHNPKMGMIPWLKNVKNYYLPSVNVRNCCSTYKEGKLKDVLDKKQKYLLLLGMRKYESSKRASYDWDLNEAVKKKGDKN